MHIEVSIRDLTERGQIADITLKALGLVDMTHLSDKIIDKYTKQVLGHTQQVKLPGGYVAAT